MMGSDCHIRSLANLPTKQEMEDIVEMLKQHWEKEQEVYGVGNA